jgi:hypothetical protein
VVDAIDAEIAISYADIPGARASTVAGHSGRLILGRAGRLPVANAVTRSRFIEIVLNQPQSSAARRVM